MLCIRINALHLDFNLDVRDGYKLKVITAGMIEKKNCHFSNCAYVIVVFTPFRLCVKEESLIQITNEHDDVGD